MKRFFAIVVAAVSLLGLMSSCGPLKYNDSNNDAIEKVEYDAGDGYYIVGVPIIQAAYLR
jgi:hypothetical protein